MSTKPAPAACVAKIRLQAEWAKATDAYAQAVKSLTNEMGKLPRDMYEKLRDEVEAARRLSEKLRHDFEMHTLSHGC
jgi:hypothetical protein